MIIYNYSSVSFLKIIFRQLSRNIISKYLSVYRKQSVKKHSVVFLWVKLELWQIYQSGSDGKASILERFPLCAFQFHLNSGKIASGDHLSFPELLGIEVTLTFTLSHMHTPLQLNTQTIKAKHIGKIFGLWYVQNLISNNQNPFPHHSDQCWWQGVFL